MRGSDDRACLNLRKGEIIHILDRRDGSSIDGHICEWSSGKGVVSEPVHGQYWGMTA